MKIQLASVSGETKEVEIQDGLTGELTGKVCEHFGVEPGSCALRFLRDGDVLSLKNHMAEGDFVTFVCQELPSVRLVEGDVHWTNDNSPSLEPTEIAAVITTRGCGPGNQVTRQCVKAAKNYCLHFCRRPDVTSVIRSVAVDKDHIAIIHRKTGGTAKPPFSAEIDARIEHEVMDDGTLVCRMLFAGGFPNGGECFADVHAPWGQCYTDIPPNGCVILDIPCT